MTGDPATPKTSECLAGQPRGGQGTQCTTVPSSTQEEEDLALAQALSASEAEYQQSRRQVSEAGCKLCAMVRLILAWLCQGGVLPGFCFLWALSWVTFSQQEGSLAGGSGSVTAEHTALRT